MKSIKNFIWFIKESPKFMNKSLIYLLFYQKLISRAIWYVRAMNKTEKLMRKYGSERTYCIMNKTLQIN